MLLFTVVLAYSVYCRAATVASDDLVHYVATNFLAAMISRM